MKVILLRQTRSRWPLEVSRSADEAILHILRREGRSYCLLADTFYSARKHNSYRNGSSGVLADMKDNLERIRSWAEVWKERETDFASAAPRSKTRPRRRSTARRAGASRGALLMLLRTLVSLSGQWRIEMAGDLTVGMADVRPLAQSYIGSAWRRRPR